jgi:hypothetical protein
MRAVRVHLGLAIAAALLIGAATPASAHDLGGLVREHGDLPEVVRLAELHRELHGLLSRYLVMEAEAGRAWLDAAEATGRAEAAARASAGARTALDRRIRTAYQLGPAAPIEALLGAATFADLATISEFTARTIALDDAAVRETVVAEAVLLAERARAEAARDGLDDRLADLRTLLGSLEAKVEEASALADAARIEDERLEEQAQAVAAAVSRAGSWDLGVIDYEQDQSHLLALLGPTGGRTCDTPEGLVETGEAFEGDASWYGWEFGGQPTATGAIFDPRLFTAANRWLPFGTFLRVRHGDRCAIVLINDRGPYGRLERVIDLSQAAAEYLGVGVSFVRAELLVPREGLAA